MSENVDLEAGEKLQISAEPSPNPDTYPSHKKSAAERLNLFRTLVGIQTPQPEPGHPRQINNKGVYNRVVKTFRERKIQYYTTAFFINVCLFGQIILGAALTALGAAAASHVSIAVLGTFNTVIAGVMTYLKGQGLPDRLRDDANELRRVREYLEQIERQLMAEDGKVTPEREAKLIYEMYKEVRKNAEHNVSSTARTLDSAKVHKRAMKQEKGTDGPLQSQPLGGGSTFLSVPDRDGSRPPGRDLSRPSYK